MVVILPLFAFLLFVLLSYLKSDWDPAAHCWRSAFLRASLIWGVSLTAITELLSLFARLTFHFVATLWGAVIILSLVFLWSSSDRLGARPFFRRPPTHLAPGDRLLLLGAACLIVVVGLIAIVSAPNTWDSMTYHMSRVEHWITNRSVALYPSHISRQLHSGPWAEFAILHLQILSGGDRLANLVQWFSLVGSALGVSAIARQLGASPRGQIFAAVFCVSLPMGILQGSSTQNDYVLSFWLVCAVYSLLLMHDRLCLAVSLALGASLGLATLTKGVAYVYSFAFVLCFFPWLLIRWRRRLARHALLVVLTMLSINLGFYMRNLNLYGHPLGPVKGSGHPVHANDMFSIPVVVSNLLRNLGLQMATPSEQLNAAIQRGILSAHTFLRVDINDPRTTWPGVRFQIESLFNDEDYAGNPVHLILIAAALVLVVGLKQPRGLRLPRTYSIALVVGFLLFTACLKWQPWHSRLHLPLLVLSSALIGAVASKGCGDKAPTLIAATLFLAALPFVFCNRSRPLIGEWSILGMDRIGQYFAKRPHLKEPYVGAANFLTTRKCPDIGVSMGEDDWEYPLWVLLAEGNSRPLRIVHVNVQNRSATIALVRPFDGFNPCAIVSLNSNQRQMFTAANRVYTREWSLGTIDVFVK